MLCRQPEGGRPWCVWFPFLHDCCRQKCTVIVVPVLHIIYSCYSNSHATMTNIWISGCWCFFPMIILFALLLFLSDGFCGFIIVYCFIYQCWPQLMTLHLWSQKLKSIGWRAEIRLCYLIVINRHSRCWDSIVADFSLNLLTVFSLLDLPYTCVMFCFSSKLAPGLSTIWL